MKEELKRDYGITLVALIITIIILLILAGISIQVLSQTNLFEQAKLAKNITENAQKEEKEEISKLEDAIYDYSNNVEQVTDKDPGKLEIDENNNDTYIINSIEDLVFFAYDVTNGNSYLGKTVKLGASLDFNSSKSYIDCDRTDYEKYGYKGKLKEKIMTDGFIPIGKITNNKENIEEVLKNNSFNGIFDGNGNTIKNLKIIEKITNKDEGIAIGLFAINCGTLQNIKLIDVDINAEIDDNLYFSVSALAGTNYINGIIKRCYVTGNVYGFTKQYSFNIGGIAGSNSGKIDECYNNAKIYSKMNSNSMYGRIGGVVGVNESAGIINNIYNIGQIKNEKCDNYKNNSEYIGGLVGLNMGILNNGYSKGSIENYSTYNYIRIGNITGSNQKTLENCYFLNNNTIINESDANTQIVTFGTQVTEKEIKDNNFITKLNENNLNIWKSDTSNINNGYPILYWQ